MKGKKLGIYGTLIAGIGALCGGCTNYAIPKNIKRPAVEISNGARILKGKSSEQFMFPGNNVWYELDRNGQGILHYKSKDGTPIAEVYLNKDGDIADVVVFGKRVFDPKLEKETSIARMFHDGTKAGLRNIINASLGKDARYNQFDSYRQTVGTTGNLVDAINKTNSKLENLAEKLMEVVKTSEKTYEKVDEVTKNPLDEYQVKSK